MDFIPNIIFGALSDSSFDKSSIVGIIARYELFQHHLNEEFF